MDKSGECVKRETIERDWRNFWQLFLALGFLHFFKKTLLEGLVVVAGGVSSSLLLLLSVGLDLVVGIGAALLIGYYAYKFSKSKAYALSGLLGLWWGPVIILPLIGALIVERRKSELLSKCKERIEGGELKKSGVSRRILLYFLFLIIAVLLFAIIVAYLFSN